MAVFVQIHAFSDTFSNSNFSGHIYKTRNEKLELSPCFYGAFTMFHMEHGLDAYSALFFRVGFIYRHSARAAGSYRCPCRIEPFFATALVRHDSSRGYIIRSYTLRDSTCTCAALSTRFGVLLSCFSI